MLVKLFLTAVATTILLLHMPAVSRLSNMASRASASKGALGQLPVQDLLHAIGGLAVLITVTALSVYKPWGRTPYGQRRQHEARDRRRTTRECEPPAAVISQAPTAGRATARSSWMLYALLGTIGLLLLMLALHIAGGGMRRH